MNVKLACLLAQVGTEIPSRELVKPTQWSWLHSRETMLVVGLAAALAVGLFAWAFFFRKRQPNDPRRRIIEPGSTKQDGTPASEEEPHHHRRRHRRHHHSHHTHRNPTLAETGGLPLPRPEDQPPAF